MYQAAPFDLIHPLEVNENKTGTKEFMTAWTLLIIAALTAIGFFVGRARAQGLRNAGTASLHSLPTYHGLLMASMALAAAGITTLAVALFAVPTP